MDAQAWSGLTRLGEVVDRLRPQLRVYRSESGRELFDLPEAPRPDPELPLPVRFVAEYDNLILSHADRTRVISDAARKTIASRNGQVPGTVLVDGAVRGMWKAEQPRRGAATLTVTPFGRPLSARRGAGAGRGGRAAAALRGARRRGRKGAADGEEYTVGFAAPAGVRRSPAGPTSGGASPRVDMSGNPSFLQAHTTRPFR